MSATTTTADRAHSKSKWPALIGWMALTLLTGAIGGIASVNAREFYATLAKPTWAPPGWLFGPVWTVLYVLMATAAWVVSQERPSHPAGQRARRVGLTVFVAQLALNALWTWLFFAWRQGAWAFAEIIVLWLAIAFTAVQFARVRRVAAWCLVPYLAWVSFAAALTWAVWRGNPGQL